MIYIKLQGHIYEYDIKEMVRQYFPKENIQMISDLSKASKNELIIINGLKVEKDKYKFYTIFQKKNQILLKEIMQLRTPSFENDKEKQRWEKRKLKVILYYSMEKQYSKSLPWGILTGIRPTKIVHKLMDEEKKEENIAKVLKSQFLLSNKKIKLLMDVVKQERDIVYPIDKNKVSIYIGIPFCPSRCVYCSFLSSVIQKNRESVKEYLQALYYEIKEIGKYINKHSLSIESIYIGGGTPTVLKVDELKELLDILQETFNIDEIKEYTLEAGRPDTINKEKLIAALSHGIKRISINPQTMNQKTLQNIGRMHSVEDIKKAYFLAREIGFSFINMDLILGLPGEDLKDVKRTLKEIEILKPENITVHTMSVKKGSKLKERLEEIKLDQGQKVSKMIEVAQDFASSNGYYAYYLYRQKYMLGNLENVGYCKAGYRSIYNIQMIAEKQTIIGLGAGSVTKVVFQEKDRIERMPNVKNVEQYIKRIQEMIDRKLSLLDSLYCKI